MSCKSTNNAEIKNRRNHAHRVDLPELNDTCAKVVTPPNDDQRIVVQLESTGEMIRVPCAKSVLLGDRREGRNATALSTWN